MRWLARFSTPSPRITHSSSSKSSLTAFHVRARIPRYSSWQCLADGGDSVHMQSFILNLNQIIQKESNRSMNWDESIWVCFRSAYKVSVLSFTSVFRSHPWHVQLCRIPFSACSAAVGLYRRKKGNHQRHRNHICWYHKEHGTVSVAQRMGLPTPSERHLYIQHRPSV